MPVVVPEADEDTSCVKPTVIIVAVDQQIFSGMVPWIVDVQLPDSIVDFVFAQVLGGQHYLLGIACRLE